MHPVLFISRGAAAACCPLQTISAYNLQYVQERWCACQHQRPADLSLTDYSLLNLQPHFFAPRAAVFNYCEGIETESKCAFVNIKAPFLLATNGQYTSVYVAAC